VDLNVNRSDHETSDVQIQACRACSSQALFTGLNLGQLPIANELFHSKLTQIEKFPLHLQICSNCGQGQVQDIISPQRLFEDYRYLSSTSISFVEHANQFVQEMLSQIKFEKSDWVLEIASNDGYLLQHFINSGIQVLGIEPAKNVAERAISNGVPTISKFFGLETANEILKTYGYPKLIIANNVLAHVPNIKDFVLGLAHLTSVETLISIENPSLMNLLELNQFDTIYHEHFSYLTANSVSRIAALSGLCLFHVEKIKTHGGSNRYWVKNLASNVLVQRSVQSLISLEIDGGLFDEDRWGLFAGTVENTIRNFEMWVEKIYQSGENIFGYGAAAKASTLINASNVLPGRMRAIFDSSTEKQGRFMPAQMIPIISPQSTLDVNIDNIVIFPWNIVDEIIPLIINQFGSNIKIWRAIPQLEQLH
jgi:hypothetical protein